MGIIRVRKRLIDAAHALADHGTTPPGAREPARYAIRAASAVVEFDGSWIDATAVPRVAVPGVNYDAP